MTPPTDMRQQLSAMLEKLDAAQERLRIQRAERAASPPKIRRRPSAARLRRRRGPADADHRSHEDREFARVMRAQTELIERFRETALKIALAAR